MPDQYISVRGARVHNLQDVDLDVPRGQLVVFCGVSGSGKTSMALDTLYAEGQRRYIESFSAYTRQFLSRLDKPDAESIEGLPPAVAVVRASGARGNRSTVATATELADYLRLLWSKVATLICYRCGTPVRSDTPQSAAVALSSVKVRARAMIGFEVHWEDAADGAAELGSLQQQGFVRILVGDKQYDIGGDQRQELVDALVAGHRSAVVVVDRVSTETETDRLAEAFETALGASGRAVLLLQDVELEELSGSMLPLPADGAPRSVTVEGRGWYRLQFSHGSVCETCGTEYPEPEPRLFNFNHPLGACRECEGFGDRVDIDMAKVVPDPSKSLRAGAIAPWNTPSYRHELDELLALADDYSIPVDLPFSKLPKKALRLVQQGVPERDFGGLEGFFKWLERKKYKMHIRVLLSRLRSYSRCPSCQGQRLKPEALAYRVAGRSIADVYAMQASEASEFLAALELDPRQQSIAGEVIHQAEARLAFLQNVGLGYLQLNRTLRTLSGGENQRVSLASALGSTLVNMLYVLDEPTVGLHPVDVRALSTAIAALQQRGNSVIAVEHNPDVIAMADSVVEFGPAAGASGGRVVFQGTPQQMQAHDASLTGDYLAQRRGVVDDNRTVRQPRGFVQLRGATGNNLKEIDVDFPLGVLCLVTGVSGSGKSTLVQDTLYGAISRRKRKPGVAALPYRDLTGAGQIEDCLLIDQTPISRSPRSNPVTYIKAFDAIRNVFAETLDARMHNYTATHFSFNSDAGRCDTCGGDGQLQIDMQFLADVYMQCPACKGARYRREILEVRYRDHSIADVLSLTVRQALSFFRGQAKVQAKLQRLVDVGLDYLQLGQPANTLSSGESQRLKLASFLAASERKRTLFLLDEPTVGLHPADITRLLDCFGVLLDAGHSLIVVEHNLQLMRSADYLIDLGPGAADAGGRVVAAGPLETILQSDKSQTAAVIRAIRGENPAA